MTPLALVGRLLHAKKRQFGQTLLKPETRTEMIALDTEA